MTTPMARIRTVCIVGLGLIGGSLGMALRSKGAVSRVVGVDIDQRIVEVAVQKGAIDEAAPDLAGACREADLVVIATPVRLIPGLIREILPYLSPGAVITDVGSTKAYVYQALTAMRSKGPAVAFVGGHPMAGSERAGIEAARENLFEGANYVLCPPVALGEPPTSEKGLQLLRELVRAVGANPVVMDPGEHDRVVSLTSHLPYVAAVGVAAAARAASTKLPLLTTLMAGGFRDTTRVASGNPTMSRDMLLTDMENLREAIGLFRREVDDLERLVAEASVDREEKHARIDALTAYLAGVKKFRDKAVGSRHDTVVVVRPAPPLGGVIRVPGDKSISHRAAIVGAIAHGLSEIENYAPGRDCASTLSCLRDLGVRIDVGDGVVRVWGEGVEGLAEPQVVLDAGNSGTTMRLLSGVLAACDFFAVLSGDESLRRRPMDRVAEPLRRMGARVEGRGGGRLAPLVIRGGRLRAITYETSVPSAQLKSAILLAGLHADGITRVVEPVLSRDHTERMLRYFGAEIAIGEAAGRDDEGGVAVRGGIRLTGRRVIVPGDVSSASFWAAAAAMIPGSEIVMPDVGVNPTRIGFLEALRQMGAQISFDNERECCGEPVADISVRSGELRAITITPERIPALIDEVPLLAVVATQARGTTRILGAGELRVKESDRLAAIVTGLRRLGADVTEENDGLGIIGPTPLAGDTVIPSGGDHRIAMAMAVAGLAASPGSRTVITDAECAAISYPGFWSVLRALMEGDGTQ